MTDIHEDDDWGDSPTALVSYGGQPMNMYQQVTTKVPPAFNGTTSWFAYEEAIDDWCDITELEPEKRGPALRNRLEGEAAVYKPLLDRDQLRHPQEGVKYFKQALRPHFVKSSQSVFLWRFFQLFKAHRGSQDMLRWIGRLSVLRKRIGEAWMDLFTPVPQNEPGFVQNILRPLARQQLAANGIQAPGNFDPFQVLVQADIDLAHEGHNAQLRQEHQDRFPISDNLFALITTCLADLNEQQRERMSSTLALRGFNIQGYTYQMVRDVFMELFCAPKSSLDNPNLRSSPMSRSFCVMDEGDMDGTAGYWVEDDETGEVGFLPEFDDIFWVFDDTTYAWHSHHFKGRRLRRGPPRGKGKGKGKGGRSRFRSRKGKGKGKGKGVYAHWGEGDESAYAVKGKGKGKKGKGKKGKEKGEGKEGKDPGGKGPQAHVASTIQSIPAPPIPNSSSPAFSVDDTWYQDTWWTGEDYGWTGDTWWTGEYETAQVGEWLSQDWDGSQVSGFFVQCVASSFISSASVFKTTARTDSVNVVSEPTYVILDLGCTRAMGSRVAVNRLLNVAHHYGITYEILPTDSKFNFANSQTATCTERVRLWLPTNPPIHTDFDIVEEGNVPLLLSLPQMRNLHFTLELSPDGDYLISPAFNNKKVKVKSALSNHLVLDLCSIEGLPAHLPKVVQNPDIDPNYPSFVAETTEVEVTEPVEAAPAALVARKKPKQDEAEPEVPPPPVPVVVRRKKVRLNPDEAEPELESAPAEPVSEAPKPPQDTGESKSPGGMVPPALAKLHKRLEREVELYKLHVKHYHMSPTQFKKRTAQLALPDSVYEKYTKMYKSCPICSTPRQAPSRSRISGIRANNFGDIIFVDHTELKFNSGTLVVLLILDAATHLLWAQAQPTLEEKHTLQSLREWIDQNNCIPKTIVGDMAFFTDSFKVFYQSQGIKQMPTGPRTPWPNRAETANRLFKRQFLLMQAYVKLDPTLAGVPVGQLVKRVVWARNNQLTIGGFTPLELAFGRRPPDLVDYETASPEELTTDPLTQDKLDRTVRKLALRAHLEARQAEDLRLDLAKNVRPSEGPFEPGTRVFFWDKDPSKIKDNGRWVRGKVVSHTKSMVTIETSAGVHKINETKVRLDHDEWHDVPIPILDEDPDEKDTDEPDEPAQAENGEGTSSSSSGNIAHTLWLITGTGDIDFLEIFAGSQRLSSACAQLGYKVGSPIDKNENPHHDLLTAAGRELVWDIIMRQNPKVIFLAPPCTPWSQMQNINDQLKVEEQRRQAVPILNFCKDVAQYQARLGRYFVIENPSTSRIWMTKQFQEINQIEGTMWRNTDFCMFGMRDPASGKYYHKRVSLLFNCPIAKVERLFRLCISTNCKHDHEKVEGHCPGFGRRTTLSQVYPWSFCKAFSECMEQLIYDTAHVVEDPEHNSFIVDLFESFSSGEVSSLLTWIKGKNHSALSVSEHERLLNPESCRKPIPITSSKLWHYMSFANRLAHGTELLLNQDTGPVVKNLISLVRLMRATVLPNSDFSHASVLRGTYGTRIPVVYTDPSAVVIMWRKKSTEKQVWIGSVINIRPDFNPYDFCMIILWNEDKQGTYIPDPPHTDVPMPSGNNPSPPHSEGPEPFDPDDDSMPSGGQDSPPDSPGWYDDEDMPPQPPQNGDPYDQTPQNPPSPHIDPSMPVERLDPVVPEDDMPRTKPLHTRPSTPEEDRIRNKKTKNDSSPDVKPLTRPNPESDPTASSSTGPIPQSSHPPILPIYTDDEEEDDETDDSEATLVVDEGKWSLLSGEAKVCSNTASFTFPMIADELVDVNEVFLTTKAPMSKKKQLKARKEASASDLRQYSKQFRQAKLDEYKSWQQNEVFELVDMRKHKPRNFVTGRWVLTIKRDKEGNFLKCKARWVLRGFLDKQRFQQQTDSPTATRPGIRLACQFAVNNNYDFGHVDLKTAFLQGEEYDWSRDVVCQLPPESGLPAHIGARLKKPAYGMNDAPRRWWNRIDGSVRQYGMIPTRADRCVYVYYDDSKSEARQSSKSTPLKRQEKPQEYSELIEEFMNNMLDPVSGSPSKGRKAIGLMVLHVDDLFITGSKRFWDEVVGKLKKDYQIGSEDKGDVMFTGQRIRKQGIPIVLDQDKGIEELSEIQLDKNLTDNMTCPPSLHTEYRSVLGALNWLQSRTQYASAYKFSRAASAAAAPTVADVKALNKVVRAVRAQPQRLYFWPLQGPLRLIGYPDASFKNNEDHSSQRGQCIFLAEQRKTFTDRDRSRGKKSWNSEGNPNAKGSLIDYESTKIRRTTLSTTVAELYSFMKCYGTCLYLKGLWQDISGTEADIHMRTDAHNLVTTAATTHLPEQKETIHMIQMLRKEANSGRIDDLAHVVTSDCLSDCLTKHSAKPDSLVRAVETGIIPNTDSHPPFRSLLDHKAYLVDWVFAHISHPHHVISMFAEPIHEPYLTVLQEA